MLKMVNQFTRFAAPHHQRPVVVFLHVVAYSVRPMELGSPLALDKWAHHSTSARDLGGEFRRRGRGRGKLHRDQCGDDQSRGGRSRDDRDHDGDMRYTDRLHRSLQYPRSWNSQYIRPYKD